VAVVAATDGGSGAVAAACIGAVRRMPLGLSKLDDALVVCAWAYVSGGQEFPLCFMLQM
jgi:hypothetical protein